MRLNVIGWLTAACLGFSAAAAGADIEIESVVLNLVADVEVPANEAGPLVNRGISTTLPPGSTFKLVTAAAAIESGQYQRESLVPGGSSLDLPQTDQDLPNSGGASCGGEQITMTQAMMVSCNVAFGWLGLLSDTPPVAGFRRRG